MDFHEAPVKRNELTGERLPTEEETKVLQERARLHQMLITILTTRSNLKTNEETNTNSR